MSATMLQDFGSSSVAPPAMATMDVEAGKGNGHAKLLSLKFAPAFQFLAEGRQAETLMGVKPIKTIEFGNINYSRNKREVLTGVSGRTRAGNLTVITGPPKCGKTKLLNVLAGTVQTGTDTKQTLSGTFLANGSESLFSIMRPGFVPKNENIFNVGTVQEELDFAAGLRLPTTVPQAEKAALIEDLLKSLGLEADRNTVVKKLPKAKKKLLAMGIELVTLPNVLFLDEPTTGLDPVSAWEVVAVLQGLAASGACTVVCSLQQPAAEVFALLSHIIVMANGRLIFEGLADEIAPVFSQKGLACPKEHNPLDYAILCCRLLAPDALPSRHTYSGVAEKQVVTRKDIESSLNLRVRHRNMMVEFGYLFRRELRAHKRDPRLLIGRMIASLFIFALCACVFIGVGDVGSSNYFVGSHFGSFVFTMFTSCFGVMVPNVMYIFESKGVFVRERAQSTYSTIPFVLARAIPEIVLNFVVALLCVVMMYWSAQWHANFGMLVVIYWLLLLSCMSWAYFLALSLSNEVAAVGLVALVLVPQLLFMGTFVRISTMPVWLSWISYICNITYALRMIQAVELNPAYCGLSTGLTCRSWAGLLNANEVNVDNVWWYAVVLVAFFLVLRFLAFFKIRRSILNAKRFGEL